MYMLGMMLESIAGSTLLQRAVIARQAPICTGGELLVEMLAAAACTNDNACAADIAWPHLFHNHHGLSTMPKLLLPGLPQYRRNDYV